MRKDLNLLIELTKADLKILYRGSLMGWAVWSLLKPVMMLIVLYFVFSYLVDLNIQNYIIFLFIGLILWNFFSDATIYSMKSFLSKKDMITSIKIKKEIIILSSVLGSLLTLFLNIVILFLLLVIFKVSLSLNIILIIIVITELVLFTLGVSFLLVVLNTKFRDVSPFWEIVLQIGFWATPIVYSINIIPLFIQNYYLLNPLAAIITHTRQLILYNSIEFSFITCLIILAIFTIGFLVFEKNKNHLVEEL